DLDEVFFEPLVAQAEGLDLARGVIGDGDAVEAAADGDLGPLADGPRAVPCFSVGVELGLDVADLDQPRRLTRLGELEARPLAQLGRDPVQAQRFVYLFFGARSQRPGTARAGRRGRI